MINLTIPTLHEQLNIIYNLLSKSQETALFVKNRGCDYKEYKTIFIYDKINKWGAKWDFKDGFPFIMEFYLGLKANISNTEMFLKYYSIMSSSNDKSFIIYGYSPCSFIDVLKMLLINISNKALEYQPELKKIEDTIIIKKKNWYQKLVDFFKK